MYAIRSYYGLRLPDHRAGLLVVPRDEDRVRVVVRDVLDHVAEVRVLGDVVVEGDRAAEFLERLLEVARQTHRVVRNNFV